MKVTAPGKLMLSGEWSVLEDGVPCVVMAIDQRVSADVTESNELIFAVPGMGITAVKAKFDGKVTLDCPDDQKEKLVFVAKAVEATLRYLQDQGIAMKTFKLETNSEDTVFDVGGGKKAKVGFGSSAAIVAATVAAVMAFHGQEIAFHKAKEHIFKLGCIAHYLAQGKIGSSFDVAASTFGGALVYQKPDMKWVSAELASGKKISDIVKSEWPLFMAETIALPKDFDLSIGFVGYSASTKDLILKLNTFKEQQKPEYQRIIADIKSTTQSLIIAIKASNKTEIFALLKKNRVLLKELSDKSQNNLETKELALLADIADRNGGVGKFSGAGGGDCGIAITFDKVAKDKIENEWKSNNITPILVGIAKKGAC
ncbi:MAG: phosphomevalonate kinase [archaeon]